MYTNTNVWSKQVLSKKAERERERGADHISVEEQVVFRGGEFWLEGVELIVGARAADDSVAPLGELEGQRSPEPFARPGYQHGPRPRSSHSAHPVIRRCHTPTHTLCLCPSLSEPEGKKTLGVDGAFWICPAQVEEGIYTRPSAS